MFIRKAKFRTWAILGALALALSSTSLAQFEAEPVQVTVSHSKEAPRSGSKVFLDITFDLAPGFHLYRDKIAFHWESLKGAEPGALDLPPGIEMDDPAGGSPDAKVSVYEGRLGLRVGFSVTASGGEEISVKGSVEYQGCEDDFCHPPASHPIDHVFGEALPSDGSKGDPAVEATGAKGIEAPPIAPPEKEPLDLDFGHLVIKILQTFGIGFLISLTPCVYPMIGITAAIIGGELEGERNVLRTLIHSLVYVFGLSLTYAILGVLTALAGAPMAQFLKSGWVLLPVAGIFILLSLAMFDVIQVQTPAFIQNRLSGVGKGGTGLPSKFALGLVSGIVATPCVAAPLIAVLMEVVTMNATLGLTASLVYGLAMLFAMAWGMGIVLIFAGVLTANFLPRSGLWMVWVKKLFGFGMLWAAVYFALPVIGALLYDLFTALILFGAVVFLEGFDRLEKDSSFFDRIKKALAIPALVFAVLLFVGAVNGLTNLFPWLDAGQRPAASARAEDGGFRRGTAKDLDSALASGRPIVLDFDATWCKVCKKLDKETLSDARVIRALEGAEALKIDFDEVPELVKRFNVLGVPTVVFLDEKGRERTDLRFSGALPPEPFLVKIDALKAVR